MEEAIKEVKQVRLYQDIEYKSLKAREANLKEKLKLVQRRIKSLEEQE